MGSSKVVKYFLVVASLILSADAYSQVGFLSTMRVGSDEPNSAVQLIEVDGQYIISGQYFDQRVGRWTTGYTFFDADGHYVKHRMELHDTVPITRPTNTMLADDKGLYKLSISTANNLKLVHYNYNLDSVWVSYVYNKVDFDMSSWGNQLSRDKSRFYMCGRNLSYLEDGEEDVKLMLVTEDSTYLNRIYKLDDNSSGKLLRENSKGKWMVACVSSRYYETGRFDEDFTYMMIFDEELNLLSDMTESGRQLPFNLGEGMHIDKDDNILVTGSQYKYNIFGTKTAQHPSIAKYDAAGNLLWLKRLGNTRNNKIGYGSWNAVIEAKEKDGYVLVGCESYQPKWSTDSIIGKAAIAKVSYEGDSIWYRTYSYREGPEVVDELNDVILSSDGHYVAAGRSADYGSEPVRPWVQSLLLKTDDKGIYLKEGVSSIEVDVQLDIKVYPNPVSSPLYISQTSDKPLRATIIDGQGRKLEGFSLENATHTHILDTSSYVAGTYFLRLEDMEGLHVTKTFVVGK